MPAARSPGLRRKASVDPSADPLSSLVYESRAVVALSELDLRRLLESARLRNRREGVTGLLIYDRGRFVQWLEGPAAGLGRIWESIRQDRRHTSVTLLGESRPPHRFFGDWPMALGMRDSARPKPNSPGRWRSGEFEGSVPAELIDRVYRNPLLALGLPEPSASTPPEHARPPAVALLPSADRGALQTVIHRVIVPELAFRHPPAAPAPFASDPHSAELARLLVAADPAAAYSLIDRVRADGRSIAELCAGLVEPAARALGDLWQADDCGEFEVTLGLAHLQIALRRISHETPTGAEPHRAITQAVLVATSPRETHLLGSVIASELFMRAGWDVSCEFPDSDAALAQLVHDRWFDVLELSLSGAFTREHRLPAMAHAIRAVHARSRNPRLVVIVDGRLFHERPRAFADVGANAGSASAMDLVSTAQRLSLARSRPVPETVG